MNQKEVLEFDGFRVERESFLALSFAFIACTIAALTTSILLIL
jgi:hypothetical protein